MITTIATIGAGVVGLAFLIRKIFQRSFGHHNELDEVDIKGKICLVTGANTGLGKVTAYELCRRGAIVILACRDENSAVQAINDIRQKTSDGELVPMKLDLASLESIRTFAAQLDEKFVKINTLILNAGVFVPLDLNMKTQDGFEINFGVNHLGHFLLTNLLLDKLKHDVPSRIVIVASTLSRKGTIDFDDLMLEKPGLIPKKKTPYENSKLANLLFSRELAARLSGTGVNVYAVCPGWVKTSLGRHINLNWKRYIAMIPIAFMFMRTTQQGVQSILHCALSKKVESGKCYRNCNLWTPPTNVNDEFATRLWNVSSSLVGLKSDSS